MNIIYHPTYKSGSTKWICVHHTGGLGQNDRASTKLLTADTINKAHKERWNFQDPITGYFGGYNFFLDYQGNITQFRAIGNETAANKGFNLNGEVISICFAGNFTKGVDMPSAEQISAFRRLAEQLPKVKYQNIKPHWFFNLTSCYGSGLSENWARSLVPELDERNNLQTILNSIQNQINQIIKLLQALKLGGDILNCQDEARG